ncbi:MAG: SNF2-related protein, partial [Brevinematia bacterium]
MPKLKIVYETVNESKKLKIYTLEDYSDVYLIADGYEKRVLRGNNLYIFNNPIPIENWITILENRFKIGEKEFPKFFGKFYKLLSQFAEIDLSEEIDISKPVIVDVKNLSIKLYLDYNESIEKLYWEPIIIFNNKETKIKDLFNVLTNHIEIDDNHFVSDLKELRQIVLNELYSIGMKEYIISINNLSHYIPIEKDSFVKRILSNYKDWDGKVLLSNRTKFLVPIDVDVIFDVEVHEEGKNNFRFQFRAFLLDKESNNIVKDMPLELFIKMFSDFQISNIIEIGGRYFKINNLQDIQKLIEKVKDLIVDDRNESSLVKLIRILSLEDELLESNLIQSLKVKKDANVERLKNEMKNVGDSKGIELPKEVENIMREYQKVGYYWLNFLYRNSFGGILADDMGLGKTLQALAFIKRVRSTNTEGLASLVVCPTSLTHNWAREIDKFFP